MAFDSTEWAWRDMQMSFNGVRIGKITKCTSKTMRESEHLYGEGDDPFDINPGNKSYVGEVEVHSTVIAKMNATAIAAGGNDLTDIPWNISILFKATATDPRRILNVPGVRFEEFEEGGSNNEKSFKKILPYKSLRPIPGV